MPGDLDTLLPHRPPMQWITALVECAGNTATATACFPADHFAVTDGFVTESALVECVAQTVAAARGQRAQSGLPGPTRGGMLAAVSGFRILSRPAAGKLLRIETRELKTFGPMILVGGVISCDGAQIASGELTLYA